jgi:hypothetical protein
MLIYDPDDRIASKEVMKHAFFKDMEGSLPTAKVATVPSSSKEVVTDQKAEATDNVSFFNLIR